MAGVLRLSYALSSSSSSLRCYQTAFLRTLALPSYQPLRARVCRSRHRDRFALAISRFGELSLGYGRPWWSFSSTFRSFAAWDGRQSSWNEGQTPYDVLGLDWNSDEEEIKAAYRKMAKLYHPDVYDGSVDLEEDETIEARFIKVQAAYELLMNKEERRQYDYENRLDPRKASKSWMEWVLKKKAAFEQRGDMAVSLWEQQQQREMKLKARQLSRQKMDAEEERRMLARQKQASVENFETTIKRHTLVLKKRDILRQKAEAEAQKKLFQKLLAAEGLELETDSDDN